ncbi:hypothetical protein EDD86DRAFT_264079 [Gorgonomyces haynaldii]|nr:hypothetical protein EDD86DRAFT_264079 [Gorgonomyces haynaldii]
MHRLRTAFKPTVSLPSWHIKDQGVLQPQPKQEKKRKKEEGTPDDLARRHATNRKILIWVLSSLKGLRWPHIDGASEMPSNVWKGACNLANEQFEGAKKRHYLMFCLNCHRAWNRDANAALNTLRIFKCMVAGEERPKYLQRRKRPDPKSDGGPKGGSNHDTASKTASAPKKGSKSRSTSRESPKSQLGSVPRSSTRHRQKQVSTRQKTRRLGE